MQNHIRKILIAGLVMLTALPALAGCVVAGPGWHHGYHDRYDGHRDHGWRR